jgi:Tol biopolymer transport system component
MPLAPGVRLGAYQIISLLGAGAMGEVYRARDTRLGRDVAIKVIPPAFSSDPDRLQRFEQEARAAATLNHPNILSVHDLGTHDGAPFIVSELLEGETLRARVSAGPLPVRKAIELGIQIAHALAAAHEKGIVHRDLKPENIFVNTDGRAKVLDFGLAKLTQGEGPLAATSELPTTPVQTQHGIVLGTLGYMAPEQVRGLTADHRADIFAFGAILYEMLSGRRAFQGETTADTMSAILKEDPPDLPVAERHIPPALARIIDRCLEKSAAARFHSTHDLAIALETLSLHSDSVAVPVMLPTAPRRGALIPWAVAALALTAAIATGAWAYIRTRPAEAPTYRATLMPPEGVLIGEQAPSRLIALSPDGRRLAFVGTGREPRRTVWVRSLDSLTAQELTGSEDAFSPFWSPDGRSVGFFAGTNVSGKLKRIDLDGGPPTTLCDYVGAPVGADWNADGVILFTTTGPSDGALRRVPAAGGTPEIVMPPDTKAGEIGIWWPAFLPDGRHFLYLSMGSARTARSINVASLDSAERVTVMKGGSNVRYADGRLIFLRGETLMSQRFNLNSYQLEGDATPLAEGVQINAPTGAFTVSQTGGVLAYKTGEATGGGQLTWFDTSGRQLGTVGNPGRYGDLQLSPDGTRAVVTLFDSVNSSRDLWLVDLARDLMTRFTFTREDEQGGVWSPDGSRVAFRSNRSGSFNIYEKRSDGAGEENLISAGKVPQTPLSWSPDGKFLLFVTGLVPDPAPGAAATGGVVGTDLWVMPSAGDRKPFPFLTGPYSAVPARFSPNGQWVAYVSNESGRLEVYVASFPGPGSKSQVSRQGGQNPIWSRDGKQLFYVTLDAQLMAVPVTLTSSRPDFGVARPLFSVRQGGPRSFYDVTADGRILMITAPDRIISSPITLVVNWAPKDQ